MANDHPFQNLFETLGREPAAHAESVNRLAFETLAGLLAIPVERPGRCILLRAPRAGHGKTHLLSRIQHQLGTTSEFIPLHAAGGRRIDAASVIDDTLRRLVRQLPASGGLTVLDLVTRRLFASALQPLVASGEVPCQDREGALAALRSRPIETFDFHHPGAVTAQWAKENFEVLGQRLSQELAQRADLPASDVAFWVDALFHFASSPLDSPGRVTALMETVHAASAGEVERLAALLGMLTLLTRVVLVADDLEGFSTNESAALSLAAFLGTLRQAAERVDVILSLNNDVWQSAFLPRLSEGLADRLSEVVVELKPLTNAEMLALLESRAPGLGETILGRIDTSAAGTHARGIIRAAGAAWTQASAQGVDAEAPFPVEEAVKPAPAETFTETLDPTPQGVDAIIDDVGFAEPFLDQARETTASAEASPPFEEPAPRLENPTWPEETGFPAPFADSDWDAAFSASTPFAGEPWEPLEALDETPVKESPFVAAPYETAASAPPKTETPPWPAPSPFSIPDDTETPRESPFRAFAETEHVPPPPPAAEPAAATEAAAETTPTPTADTDRVDDLLRQFRERYGRGSL